MKKRVILTGLFVCVLMWGSAGTARADGAKEDLCGCCDDLIKALMEDPAISAKTKEALSRFAQAVVKKQERTSSVTLGVSDEMLSEKIGEWFMDKSRIKNADDLFGTKDKKGIFERLNIYGNIRMRYQLSTNRDRYTQRYGWQETRCDRSNFSTRFRLGFEYEVNPDMWVGARVTTGSHDNANTAESGWDNDFSKWDINLDRVYIKYAPFNTNALKIGENEAKLDIYLGKFQHHWLFLTGPEFWDGDVQPEGVAAGLKFYPKDCNFVDLVQLSLAGYVIAEEPNNDDASTFAAQLRLEKSVDYHGKWDFKVAGAFYDFNDPESFNNGSSIWNSSGSDSFSNGLRNAPGGIGSPTPQEFISDFELLHFYTQVTYTGIEILNQVRPISLLFEYTHNTNAGEDYVYGHGDQNKGYNILLYLGKLKKQGDWKVGYGYFNFERDSLFTLVSGNDFPWQTNYDGHWIDTYYRMFDNTTLHTQFFFGKQKIDDSMYEGARSDRTNFRLRVEILVNF